MNAAREPARRRWLAPLAAAALLLGAPSSGGAHDIPATVMVRMFANPDGDRLRFVIRVPLAAMRDVVFPVRGPGYLDVPATGPLLDEAVRKWIVGYLDVFEDGRPLRPPQVAAARISLPSDLSFADYATAVEHVVSGPPVTDRDLIWTQALLDVALDYEIASDQGQFSIIPRLAHLGLRTRTVLVFVPPTGTERAFQYDGDPGRIRLDPRWHQAAAQFVRLGFQHILDGTDHLLFVLCLIIPFRRWRPLVAIITSFTVAHSITLIASTFGLAPRGLWFPPFIETLIALSIVYMAFENIVGAKIERRWVIAFAFGLVHGFGFSFALQDSLQFAGAYLVTSLFAFNVGVELGQLFVVALAVPVLSLLLSRLVAERIGVILLSALVAHSAWHWMADRWGALRSYTFQWPVTDLALAASTMRAVMLVLILAGALWLLHGLYGRLMRPVASHDTPAAKE